jgi:hypothetical protein
VTHAKGLCSRACGDPRPHVARLERERLPRRAQDE